LKERSLYWGSFLEREYSYEIAYKAQIDDVLGEDTVEERNQRLLEVQGEGTELEFLLEDIFGDKNLPHEQTLMCDGLLPLFRRKGTLGRFSFEYELFPQGEGTSKPYSEEEVWRRIKNKQYGLEAIWVLDPTVERGGFLGYHTVFKEGVPGKVDATIPEQAVISALEFYDSEEAIRRLAAFQKAASQPYDPEQLSKGLIALMRESF